MRRSTTHVSRIVSPALPILLLAIGFLLAGCSEEKVKPAISGTSLGQDVPTQESWNATITFTDSGRVTAILRAGHIVMFADRKFTLLDSSITVDFFDRRQHHTSVLTARRGKVNDITHDFEAHENVVVIADSGRELRTEELFWNNNTQRITTPAFVDIKTPTEHIQGQGFESDQSLSHYTLLKVTGQAKSNE